MRQARRTKIATGQRPATAYGVERLVRYAFTKAQARAAKHLTLVHKHNVLVHAGDLWRLRGGPSAQVPRVAVDCCHVDRATITTW